MTIYEPETVIFDHFVIISINILKQLVAYKSYCLNLNAICIKSKWQDCFVKVRESPKSFSCVNVKILIDFFQIIFLLILFFYWLLYKISHLGSHDLNVHVGGISKKIELKSFIRKLLQKIRPIRSICLLFDKWTFCFLAKF